MVETSDILTKHWKAGKLEPDNYYIETIDGTVEIGYAGKWYDRDGVVIRIGFDDDENVLRILARVPSYVKYQVWAALIENGSSAIETNKVLTARIAEYKDKYEKISSTYTNTLEDVNNLASIIVKNEKELNYLYSLLKQAQGCVQYEIETSSTFYERNCRLNREIDSVLGYADDKK